MGGCSEVLSPHDCDCAPRGLELVLRDQLPQDATADRLSGGGPPSPAGSTQEPSTLRPSGPFRGRRRMSGPPLIILLLGGALVGGAAGVLYSRGWLFERQQADEGSGQAVNPQVWRTPPTLPPPLPDIVFSTSSVRPAATPEVLEAGTPVVFCFFSLREGRPKADLKAYWLLPGMGPVEAQGKLFWDAPGSSCGHIVLRPPRGAKVFQRGIYEVVLRAGEEEIAEGSFVMLKRAASLVSRPPGLERYRPEVKNVVVFSGSGPFRAEKPYVLPAGTSSVRVTFRYKHALEGSAFTVQWLFEDGLIQQATTEVLVRAAEGTGDAWFATKPPKPLPVGKYGVLILMGENTPPLAQESFWIGRRPTARELQKVQ